MKSFKEFIKEDKQVQINEASLSRVWQHVNSDRPIAIITAFRHEYTQTQNVQRNKLLAAKIRKLGYGYFFLDGYWIEKGPDSQVPVKEDSLFVIGDIGSDDEFIRNLVSLTREFDQEAVLIKSVNGANLYNQSGMPFLNVGELKAGKMGQIYSKLRNNKQSNTFIFENERDGSNWFSKLAGIV